MLFVAVFAILGILAIRFQALLGGLFQIVMIVLVFGAGINLFKAYTNNAATALGLSEPYTLPQDQQTLLRDVRMIRLDTRMMPTESAVPNLLVLGDVQNNSKRPIQAIELTCTVTHGNGQKSYFETITTHVKPGEVEPISARIKLSYALSRENPNGYSCAMTRVDEAI